jgi:glucose-6-phosphate 1-dehydrogenase
MSHSAREMPTVFVIFGATGDLARRKIIPSIYNLFEKGMLPETLQIIGFSRKGWTSKKFRDYFGNVLGAHKDLKVNKDTLTKLTQKVSYQPGYFEKLSDFKLIAKSLGQVDGQWEICSNKLFYLAVPPKYYKMLFENLQRSGLTKPCSSEEGWTRVIVEKPFGKDLQTAKELDRLLAKLFKEEQIFRIDHYLAKDALQNILAFRFANNIFEESWNNKFIDEIEVKVLEEEDVSGRGAFYDGVGALKDVGQNHLLQMLALVTMNNPGHFLSETIQKERERILSTLKISRVSEAGKDSVRGQYKGYRDEDGVEEDSQTETYFKAKAYLNHPKWRGVKISLEAGKAMKKQKKEIVVRFKHPSPCLCPTGESHDYHNKVIFAFEPKEEITFRLWTKAPGFKLKLDKRSFDLSYRKKESREKYIEEYQKLLLDCFMGDQTLFMTTNEIEEMWKFVDPYISAWKENLAPLEYYSKGTDSIRKKAKGISVSASASELTREIGIVGLGKMGSGIATNLLGKGWRVVGLNRSQEATKSLEKWGLESAYSLEELCKKIKRPRIIWLMVPAGEAVNNLIDDLSVLLDKGDIVIDGGNTFYKDSIRHSRVLAKGAIDFVDVGVSGGPSGARDGACLMVGGNKKLFEYLHPLYIDLSVVGGSEYFEGVGAGHFAKMVHNGIEYGMMQSIAEGFDILRNSEYKFHLKDVARIYNNGSVIESRLVEWMKDAYEVFGDDLEDVAGAAGGGGGTPGEIKNSEGSWSVRVAHSLGVKDKVIHEALKARETSIRYPNYQGKIINVLRNRFGGHKV